MTERAENRLYVGIANRYVIIGPAGTGDPRKRLIMATDMESAKTKLEKYLSRIIGGEWQIYEIKELKEGPAVPLGIRQSILEEALGEAI